MITLESSNRKKHLFLLITLLLLPLSFYIRKSTFFHPIDIKIAYFFNNLIRFNDWMRNPIAYLNSKSGNWLYDAVIAFFILPYIIRGGRKKWLERFITTLLIVALSLMCYFLFNRFITRKLHFLSISPSGELTDIFRLSSVIKWVKIKELSHISYPSDHGSTIFMFILSVYYLMGYKIALIATLASIPFALPRMVVGAHWPSDLILGSLPLALFNTAWFFLTPIYHSMLNHILKVIYALQNFRQKIKQRLKTP
jgi:membrane-associated phospholipid phosphatase